MTGSPPFQPLELIAHLVEAGVDFVMIGGLAATLHGAELPTLDIDVAYEHSPENLDRLASALRGLEVRLRGAEDVPLALSGALLRNGEMWTFRSPYGDIDCLADPAGAPPYTVLKERAAEAVLGAHSILVASIADLISMKEAIQPLRPKDIAKLAELRGLALIARDGAEHDAGPSAGPGPADGVEEDGPRAAPGTPGQVMERGGGEAWQAEAAYALSVAVLRVRARAEETMTLPPNAGSTLRGAFGHALRAVACLGRGTGGTCVSCRENDEATREGRATRCVYGYIFDTPRPQGAPMLERQQEAPHPYVVRPLASGGKTYAPGDVIEFEVALFGRAIGHTATVRQACQTMARSGFGAGRGRATVTEIGERAPFGLAARTPLPSSDEVASPTLAAGWDDAVDSVAGLSPHRITLRFLTPTTLVYNGQPMEQPTFAVLMRAVLRRMTLLALFHGGTAPTELFSRLAHRADDVRLAAWHGRWHDWERYSSRKDRRMTFGGVVGDAVYEGDLVPFLPYLVFGQATHVGKACTFGSGQYLLLPEKTGPAKA